jgi:hypothetical protein
MELSIRTQLAALRARYDHGAVHPAVYQVIKQLEIEESWRRHTLAMRRAAQAANSQQPKHWR